MNDRPRTLIINGSPHAEGGSAGLAKMFARRVGGPSEALGVYGAGFAPCLDCGGCAGGQGCVVQDGMAPLWRALARADCIVLASPLHFSSLSGPLVTVLGRLQAAWKGWRWGMADHRRFGVLLATGGGEYPGMFDAARKVAAAAFVTLGVEFVGMVGVSNLDRDGEPPVAKRMEVDVLADAVLARYRGNGG